MVLALHMVLGIASIVWRFDSLGAGSKPEFEARGYFLLKRVYLHDCDALA